MADRSVVAATSILRRPDQQTSFIVRPALRAILRAIATHLVVPYGTATGTDVYEFFTSSSASRLGCRQLPMPRATDLPLACPDSMRNEAREAPAIAHLPRSDPCLGSSSGSDPCRSEQWLRSRSPNSPTPVEELLCSAQRPMNGNVPHTRRPYQIRLAPKPRAPSESLCPGEIAVVVTHP